MKSIYVSLCTGLLIVSVANAQTPPATQARPDARYQNPSGQDSAPSQTRVNPTKTAPTTAHPEDPSTATKGQSAQQTYSAGKKADDAAGCSTPTTAADAGVAPADSRTRANGQKTVCTTTGESKTMTRRADAAKPDPKKAETKTPPADR